MGRPEPVKAGIWWAPLEEQAREILETQGEKVTVVMHGVLRESAGGEMHVLLIDSLAPVETCWFALDRVEAIRAGHIGSGAVKKSS